MTVDTPTPIIPTAPPGSANNIDDFARISTEDEKRQYEETPPAASKPVPSLSEKPAANRPNSQTRSSSSDLEVAETSDESIKEEEDVIPDGGYGWVCVFCIFLINAHTWGVNCVRNRLLPIP